MHQLPRILLNVDLLEGDFLAPVYFNPPVTANGGV
jgi:hypothetical protein